MPRAPRIHIAGGLYHVMLRGNHRDAIFHTPSDRDEFEHVLGDALERYRSHVLAYCWMTNHIHAVVRIANQPLGRLIQLAASRYARQVQRRVPTTGHLFERRYRARVITNVEYLLQAVRYIHLNPVEAGIVEDPAAYAWSSHRHYLSGTGPKWLLADAVLRHLGESRSSAVAAYLSWLGGRSQTSQPGDWMPSKLAPDHEEFRQEPPTLDALIAKIADLYRISPADIVSRRRCRVLSAARAALAREAVNSGAATLVEVATRLNRAPSTLSWLLRRKCESIEQDSSSVSSNSD